MTEQELKQLYGKVMRACVVLLPDGRSEDFDHGAKWVTQKIMGQISQVFDALRDTRAKQEQES